MFWEVHYIVASSSCNLSRICIIVADSKEKALEIFSAEVAPKQYEGMVVLDKYTDVIECENSVVLYDGSRR